MIQTVHPRRWRVCGRPRTGRGAVTLPRVDLRRLEASVSSNTDPVKAEQLRTTSQAVAAKMISDVDLYGKTGQTSQ
jgi:hypothetical protein